MNRREILHEILCQILGSRNVYFQPPEKLKMEYPCIIYERSQINTVYADDKSYINKRGYQITVVDKNPDSLILNKIYELLTTSFVRHFTSNNLNHDVFTVFY